MGGSVLRRHEIDSFLYFSTWFIFIPGSYLGSTQTDNSRFEPGVSCNFHMCKSIQFLLPAFRSVDHHHPDGLTARHARWGERGRGRSEDIKLVAGITLGSLSNRLPPAALHSGD